ncbi:MAG: mechanosensitive ion channel domain-containing protein [Pseudorhizobium pelagicum]|uniref:mechanosensitive ion channel domain-containing protein n=1 Tax=Pseudorhizobium pelagicum TaxID=1509405 RepID=UPI003460DBF3
MTDQPFLLVSLTNALGVAGIVIWHIQGRSRPTQRLVTQISFFIAMSLTIHFAGTAVFHFEEPHLRDSRLLFVAAKVLWWIHLSWATIGFVRLYVVLDRRPREARLIQDLVVAIVYLGVFLAILSFVFGVPIATLLATSGVVAIILGLALQNTLSDVFSGIALTLGRTFSIGDWILLSDGSEGRVIGSNWRATYLLTFANNVVILPNNVLAKQGLTNISRPDETHQIALSVRIIPSRAPQYILAIMQDAVCSSNSILQEPPPSVSLVGISSAAIEVQLFFRVKAPSVRVSARNEMIDLVYRHCLANGLVLAMPAETQFVRAIPTAAVPNTLEPLASALSHSSKLTPDEQARLNASALVTYVGRGELITENLFVVRTGVVELRLGEELRRRLAPGDAVGSQSVPNEFAASFEAWAITPVTLYVSDTGQGGEPYSERDGGYAVDACAC